jgi:hypothetical protein
MSLLVRRERTDTIRAPSCPCLALAELQIKQDSRLSLCFHHIHIGDIGRGQCEPKPFVPTLSRFSLCQLDKVASQTVPTKRSGLKAPSGVTPSGLSQSSCPRPAADLQVPPGHSRASPRTQTRSGTPPTYADGQAEADARSERPDERDERDRDGADQQVERQPDLYEVGKAVAARPVHDEVCLVGDR